MRSAVWMLLLGLVGCGWGAPREPAAREPAREGKVRRADKGSVGTASGKVTLAELPEGAPALVLLVVMDTVRSESVGLCGSKRTESLALQALIERGAAWTCDAYSPATWTLPSHATYFTGLPVMDHNLHRKGLRLPEESTTLAELYAERGYQTVLISANPVLHEQTGLHQGFQVTRVAPGLASELREEGFAAILKQELARLDANKPLFLFLNIFDAHDPYPAVPKGAAGFEARAPFAYRPNDSDPSNPFFQFMTGTMPPDQRAAYLAHALDTYEWGVQSADRTLGRALKVIEKAGWTEHGVRMVVTSDHGENMGEHGVIRHDGAPWEQVTRVPLLYLDSARKEPLALPAPFPAEALFELLRDGALPDPLPTPLAMSVRYGAVTDPRYADGVALWGSGDKLLWREGAAQRYDLKADPGEQTPLPAEGAQRYGELQQAIAAQQAAKAKAQGAEADAGVVKMLEAVGYVGE